MEYKIDNAEYALQKRPPKEWTIDKIIRQGSIFGMFGKGGEGKTYVALTMAVAIALGKPWMGFKVKQGNVLFINTQMEREDFADRVGEVLRGAGADKNCPLFFTTIYGLTLGGDSNGKQAQEGFETLQKMYNEIKPVIVFIDAYLDVIGNEGMKSSDVQPFFKRLRIFRDTNNKVDIGFIHHKNKTGGSYGSVDIENQCDNYMVFDGSNPATFKIMSSKSRFSQDIEIVGRKVWENETFYVSSHFSDDNLTEGEREVVKFIAKNGESAKGEIQKEISKAMGVTKATVGGYITSLVNKNKLQETTGNVTGGRGKNTAYKLIKTISDMISEYAKNAPETGSN